MDDTESTYSSHGRKRREHEGEEDVFPSNTRRN